MSNNGRGRSPGKNSKTWFFLKNSNLNKNKRFFLNLIEDPRYAVMLPLENNEESSTTWRINVEAEDNFENGKITHFFGQKITIL